ncbi:MAG: replication restart helicase PriA, partial [Chitinophagaceae bacterium]
MSSPDQQPIFFADILIPAALPTTYTWSIPSTLVDQVKVGCRVEVNLGKRKRYAGLVKRVYSSKTESRLVKPILQVLDPKPIIFSQQLKFWEWISNYYVCTQGEVMAAALPANFRLTSDTELIWNEDAGDDFSHLSTDEYLVAEALFLQKKLQISEVQLVLNRQHIYPVIEKLLSQRVCLIQESLVERYKPRKENYLSFSSPYSNDSNLEALVNNWKGSERQLNLILHFLDISKGDRAISAQQLIKSSGENISVVKALVNKGILVVQDRQVNRIEELSPFVSIDFTLSTAQRQAYKEIESVFERKDVCLLHGVTSSGKTNIYIELIASAIQKGKQVLYLLPEIALTSQIIRRLQQHFGGYVGVYHSKFSANERVEIWNRVLAGEYKIILGARSAVFLPFASLGLIICDEEHETSFKQQDPAPRYNGRDAAIYLATQFKAKVLLGSATPSLETYKHAIDQKYGLVTLTERFGAVAVPSVDLIDRRNSGNEKKENLILTAPLKEAIRQALDAKRQVILFQNRRGYIPYQVCTQCGWVPRCLHCDISLTYHKRDKQLLCHYCGSRYSTQFRCGSCGKEKFAQKNFGTELVEETLAELFPTARVARMDIDTIRGKNAHDKLVQAFETGEIDILIGTQMVVKGLDVAKVDVVG